MSVEIITLNRSLNFHLSAPAIADLKEVIASFIRPSVDALFTIQVSAGASEDLLDAIESIAEQMDDPDRIAAIRIDEDACCAEMVVAARPVDPRRLH